jgi:hypothetical protein
MKRRRIHVAIVVSVLAMAVALIGVHAYLYYFYSIHAAHHFAPDTGSIYQVGMNGRTVFLTRVQNYLMFGTWCGSLFGFGLAVYLSNRWELGTPQSII